MKKLLLILAICVMPVATICQQYNLIIDTITHNTLTDVASINSIVVDHENNIHICWYSVIDPYISIIKYTKRDCNTGNWSSPEIVSDTQVLSRFPNIAIEKSTGIPHISYIAYLDTFNIAATEIIHATKSALNEWNRELITNDSAYSLHSSIAIDDNNKCHIIWTSSNDSLQRVFYSNNIDGTWESQILTDSNYYYSIWPEFSPSIAVSSEGIAYIAFIAKTSETYAYTRLATNNEPNGTEWIYEMIDTPENNDFSVQIGLQSDSILHTLISGNEGLYNGPNNSYYTYKEINGFWSPLEFINSTGGIKSTVIDNKGKIHALQIPGGGGVLGFGRLSYTSNQTGIWANTLVEDMITESFDSFGGGSIAITDYGKICIASTISQNLSSNEVIVFRYENHCDTINNISGPINKGNGILVYPNPFHEQTSIMFNNPNNDKHSFQLINTKGQIVIEQNIIKSGQLTISRGNLKNGLYLYKLMKEGKLVSSGKLLVK